MNYNFRHLRAFLSIAEKGSVTQAASQIHLSQPALTQAIAKLEAMLGVSLFERTNQGMFLTEAGRIFENRVSRAIDFLMGASGVRPALRLRHLPSNSQLTALLAVVDAENYSLAARRFGIAQPTVYRAVKQLEMDADQPLFEKTSHGIRATRAGEMLALSARLAYAELAQAETELASWQGIEAGEIAIGSLPLARSFIIPAAISSFRQENPKTRIRVVDGPYDDQLGWLRSGEIDFLVGALRFPVPIEDIEQEELFADVLTIIAAPTHPLVKKGSVSLEDLSRYPWVVARQGTPTRHYFDALFLPLGNDLPGNLVESGSSILMRRLLMDDRHLGFISRHQVQGDIEQGLLAQIEFELGDTPRPIGISSRRNWKPTAVQEGFLSLLRNVARDRRDS
ncbi:LysR family transcriptional regulator [Hoeflea sp. TYP-13]|uniref:LysR family transcriptional regulator n=1 Tax=Hoeflea sp. TYP-13 TaxID=3230023 RepID=UPI0034C5D869